ncbi:MAG: TolC family protein [Planctomycetes bacterium]|nr:TolC family protein [Planctomycetota bacterium]
MSEALALARAHNPRLLAARTGLGVSEAKRITADQWPYNPVLSAEIARSLPFESQGDALYQVGLSQTFQTGGQRGHQVAVADANIGRAAAVVANTERLVQAAVATAFFEYLSLQERERLVQRNLDIAGGLLTAAEARYRAKQIPEVELNLVRLDQRRALNARTRVSIRQRASLVRIAALLGRPGEESKLKPVGSMAVVPITTDRTRALELAHERRPDLVALRQELKMARSKFDLEGARVWPDLGIGLYYAREVGDLARGFDRDNIFGLELSVPLPLLNRRRGEQSEALAQVRAVESRIQASLVRLEMRVDLALNRLAMARQTVELFQTGLQGLSQENLRQFQKAYEAGEVGTLAVLRARDDLNQVALGLLDALLEFHTARIELKTLVAGEIK